MLYEVITIQQAKGDVIIRMDCHSVYPKDYVLTLVRALDEYNADNVGAVIETIPMDNLPKSEAIASVMSSFFGVGNALFRIGVNKVKEVDTVPFGCFRREIFDELGLFDEAFIRNQDDEFNARMIKNGKKILLIPNVKIQYYARQYYKQVSRMFFQYGLFKPLVNYKLRQVASVRQIIPVALVLYLLIMLLVSLFWISSLWALGFVLCLYLVFLS